MPKVKTNSSAKKRFRVTGSGKLKRKQAFKRHCLGKQKKTTKQKRALTHDVIVAAADKKIVKNLLNI